MRQTFDCDLQPDGSGFRCTVCRNHYDKLVRVNCGGDVGIVRPTQAKPKKKADYPCVHRGERMRGQACQTCSGSTTLFVFACPLHGECAIEGAKIGVKQCRGCDDRRPPVTPQSDQNLANGLQ